MIVAVTGGTGFIGGTLVKRLASEGVTVRVLTRQPVDQVDLPDGVEVFQGDLVGEVEILEQFLSGSDVLYHCAAEINDNEKMLVANVDGAKNLVRAAKGKIRHWVQLSSADVYGTHVDGVINEDTPSGPMNVYEVSKAAADGVVIEAAANGDFTYSILRPSKVYGPGMRNQVLFQLFSLVSRGLFFFIGRPGASANYVHVDDVVEGLLLCGNMPAAKNRVYIISDYRTIEVFVSTIAETLCKRAPRWRIPEHLARMAARMTAFVPHNPLTGQRVNAMVKRATYSTEKLEEELGYRHRVVMEDGVRQLVLAWLENKRN